MAEASDRSPRASVEAGVEHDVQHALACFDAACELAEAKDAPTVVGP